MRNPFLLKEIRSKTGALHFKRWGIQTPWFGIFIHGIYKADEDKDLHDHPWDYISIPLKGKFIEATLNGNPYWHNPYDYKTVKFGMIIARKAETFHKINSLLTPSAYTLFLTGPRKRTFGFNVDGTWVNFRRYRQHKNEGTLDSLR